MTVMTMMITRQCSAFGLELTACHKSLTGFPCCCTLCTIVHTNGRAFGIYSQRLADENTFNLPTLLLYGWRQFFPLLLTARSPIRVPRLFNNDHTP